MALGDLLNYGEKDEALREKLLSLLADPDAGVRAVACRRAFMARLDPVFSWAVGHLDDAAKSRVNLRGTRSEVRPGEEALQGLQALTAIQEELDHPEYRRLPPERKETLRGLFLAWWEEGGKTFPAPGFREDRFRRAPSSEKSVVLPAGSTTASFGIWSGLDRTKIRVGLDEIECNASGPADFDVHFHLRYMVQGMRSDDGEAYRRHFPVGERFELARKKSGCYQLVFQALSGNRLKVRFRFFDPVR